MIIMPKSLESEKMILGCMITDHTIINLIDLEKNDFFDSKNAFLYDVIKKVKQNKEKVDLLILKDYLEGINKLNYIGGLFGLAEYTENIEHHGDWKIYCKNVKETAQRRQIIRYANEMIKIGADEENESKEVFSKIENISKHIFNINLVEKEEEGENISNIVNSFCEYREMFTKLGSLGESTKFEEVDKYTQGNIRGKIYSIVAYSNTGKSKLTYDLCQDFLKKGKKIDYYSLEVDKNLLFGNILASYEGKPLKTILNSNYDFDINKFENLKIYDNIRKFEDLKIMIRQSTSSIIFIDFIQNIQLGGSEYEKMTNIAIDLQALAIETNKTIYYVSQANNESRFKGGDMIQAKGSGAIFSNSDVMLTMHVEDTGVILTIAKNKYGPKNIRFLTNINFQTNTFKLSEEISQKKEF